MEAKDTVMSDEQLEEEIRKDYKDFSVRDETGYSQDILCWAREAQAEISFKVGIREVVEAIKPIIECLDDPVFQHNWQAKLKEWGL